MVWLHGKLTSQPLKIKLIFSWNQLNFFFFLLGQTNWIVCLSEKKNLIELIFWNQLNCCKRHFHGSWVVFLVFIIFPFLVRVGEAHAPGNGIPYFCNLPNKNKDEGRIPLIDINLLTFLCPLYKDSLPTNFNFSLGTWPLVSVLTLALWRQVYVRTLLVGLNTNVSEIVLCT